MNIKPLIHNPYIGAICFASSFIVNPVQASLIDFEDATTLSAYKGFTWSGQSGGDSWVLDNATNSWWSAYSGSKFVWSNGGSQLSLSGSVFDFNSMWAFGAFGAFYDGIGLTATGYLNGNLVYSKTVGLGSSYQEYKFNFLGVDTVVFPDTKGGQYYNLVIDDITVNAKRSVPDASGSLALLCLSISGLWAARRKFSNA